MKLSKLQKRDAITIFLTYPSAYFKSVKRGTFEYFFPGPTDARLYNKDVLARYEILYNVLLLPLNSINEWRVLLRHNLYQFKWDAHSRVGFGIIVVFFLTILFYGIAISVQTLRCKEFFDPNRILNPGIGKGETLALKKTSFQRKLKNQSNNILELECMRCGFCIASCPSRIYYMLESYSPRGRLSILNGIVHGDLKLTTSIRDIIQTCTLCGLCHTKCPAGINTVEMFEKVREIMHKKK